MGWKRAGVYFAATVLIMTVVGPFLVPIGEVPGSSSVKELARPDSTFFEFDGLSVHYRQAGRGRPPRILLHGFGASIFSFHEVFESWSSQAKTIAYDRPAFGLTERPWPVDHTARNPYTSEFSLDLLGAVIDRAGGEPAVLIGNSAGGRVAIEYALAHPEQVAALVLISPAVYTDGPPPIARLVSRLPQVDRLGPLILRWALPRFGPDGIDLAWHDPSRVTSEIREGYALPLRARYWDMALWEFSQSRRPVPLLARLAELRATRVLVVTGDDDRIVPTTDSERFAKEIDAQLVVVPSCGHLAHEECPLAWDRELEDFLANRTL